MLIEKALQQNRIDPAEVETFISHLLGKDRSFIKAFPNLKLNDSHVSKIKQFVKRRAKGEPFAYILGYKEFCGLKIKVDKRVMVPRPETEELVAEVLKHVYAIPNRNRANHWEYDKLKIVDVGTGSGNIAIALAKAIPFAKIFATERDKNALKVARKNTTTHGVSKQVELLEGDLLELINEPVDIVVANLPYIPRSRFPHLQPEVRDWEPRVALDGGKDGLKLYRALFKQIPNILKPGGCLYYEIDGQIFLRGF
jgi:release factor glutamine methyltransferase